MSTKRKQVYLAVAGSVAIHLAVLFAWALAVQWFPAAEAATSQPPDPLKLEVVEEKPEVPPTPEPERTPLAPTPKQFAFKEDLVDVPEASQAPKDAVFESGRNAEAASEFPPTGDQPLPTQKGRAVPSFHFDTHPYTPGDEGKVAGENVPENMPPPPVRETAPPPPRPQATPLAQATPPPPTATPAASVADPRDLAMEFPKSIPTAPLEAEPNPYDPSFRPPAGMTEPPRPTPVPRRGGYRPMQERTDATGNLTKHGISSVASVATPGGRYAESVKRAVDLRYRQFIDARADLMALGIVTIRFTVDRDGRVLAARIVANSANEALAAVSLRALAEAQIPSMPTAVIGSFSDGILHMEINFGLE